MSRPEITPDKIEVDRPAGVMRLRWMDGHDSVFPIVYLREQCPCATCKGTHGTTPLRMIPLESRPPAQISEVGFVGRNVAMRFTWSDGHDSGIYDFVYLREICPCEECRMGNAE